jgi:hypothetical protein
LICLQGVALVCGPVALEMLLKRSALYCTSLSCLRQSWSSRPRAVLDSSCGARGVSRPSFLLLDSTSLWPRRSSVASPVESESSASSNSRTAMQGREDRETRNKRTSRMQYLVSGRERRDVRARARRTEICAEWGIAWINQCSVVMKGGTEEALRVMYALMHRRGGWYIAASYYSHIKDVDDCRCRTRGCGVKGINGAG